MFRYFFTLLTLATLLEAACPLINVGLGLFDVSRAHPHAQFQCEYRFGYRYKGIGMPFVGVMATSKGSSYFFGGIAADLVTAKKLSVMPSFAIGIYNKGGGKNLYYPLEFRSSLECAYIFTNQSRLGIQFSHISNANLGRHNPGEESVVLSYSYPLRNFLA